MTVATEFEDRPGRQLTLVRQLATRFATIGDQMLAAVANFWLTIAIGRAFPAEDLAAYGMGLSVGLLVQALQRHTVVIPLMLEPKSRAMRRCGALMGQHWLLLGAVGLLSAAGIGVTAALGAPDYGRRIIAAAGVCLLLYAQLEFARAMLVKLGKPVSLLAGSACYAALCGALGFAAIAGLVNFTGLLALLACGMLLHAAGVSLLAGQFDLVRGWSLLAANVHRYGGWSLIATSTYAGYSHIPLFLLGALAQPLQVAAYVAARSLMQPLQILLRGLDVADKAAFAERASAPFGRAAFLVSLKLAGLYALAGGVLTVSIGLFAEPLLQITYGPKFAGFGPVLLAWIPAFILAGCSMPLESLVYARRSFPGYYLARAVGSGLAIALTAPLVFRFEAVGAVAACGVGGLVATAGALLLLYRGTER